ncbi:MAG TPA: hypothetical protein P5533_01265 [Candidatus Cloacimonadota bacterium]|nr:hypothetical protein [Candidatus Cloacimonadota bacterium]
MKISGVFFCIVIIAFLLPFMVVKCGDTKIASVSGLKLATGGNISLDYMDKMAESTKALTDMAKSLPGAEESPEAEPAKEEKSEKLKPNIWALLALLMGIGGLITSLLLPKNSYIIPLILAVGGIIALFLIKSGVKSGMNLPAEGGAQFADMIKVQAQIGYYLAFLGFIGAGVLAFLTGRNSPYVSQENISRFIPDSVENAFDKAKDTVTAAGAVVADKMDDVVDKGKEYVEKGKDFIEDAKLDEKLDDIVDKGKDLLEKANLDEKFSGVVEKVEDTVEKVKDFVDTDDTK